MNELLKYTDDQLRAELKRRSIERRKSKVKEPREKYRYYEVTVAYRFPADEKGVGYGVYEYEYDFKEQLNERFISSIRLASNCGFNKQNAPQVGDIVRIKGLNYADPTKNIFTHFHIDKIIKRKED